jgi:palmitoyl transferase
MTRFNLNLKKSILFSTCLFAQSALFAQASPSCTQWPAWFKPVCEHLNHIWNDGHIDLYGTGYAWHNRYRYAPEKIEIYNEAALGGGLGKSYYTENGNWGGLYAFAFLDSHSEVEPIAGYGFLKRIGLYKDTYFGLGYTVFLTSRTDILNRAPFPGALPLVALSYKQLSLFATYVPGAFGAGNILFCFAKWMF